MEDFLHDHLVDLPQKQEERIKELKNKEDEFFEAWADKHMDQVDRFYEKVQKEQEEAMARGEEEEVIFRNKPWRGQIDTDPATFEDDYEYIEDDPNDLGEYDPDNPMELKSTRPFPDYEDPFDHFLYDHIKKGVPPTPTEYHKAWDKFVEDGWSREVPRDDTTKTPFGEFYTEELDRHVPNPMLGDVVTPYPDNVDEQMMQNKHLRELGPVLKTTNFEKR